MLYVLLLALICVCSAFKLPSSNFISRARHRSSVSSSLVPERMSFLDSSFLLLEKDPKYEPMKKFSMILANVTEHLKNPDEAMQIVSLNTPWLMSQNLPNLTNLMLETIPALRKDDMMCLAFDFMMECLFHITSATASVSNEIEKLLQDVIVASSISTEELDKVIKEKLDQLSGALFTQYLDDQISKAQEGSSEKEMLSVLKLRILEEHAKRFSIEDRAIAELCVLDNSDERRMLVNQFLEGSSMEDKKRLYNRVVELLKQMESGSAGNASVYGNARDLETILRDKVFD